MQPLPTLETVRATTPEQLTTMTPREVDYLFAGLDSEYHRLEDLTDRAWERLYGAVRVEKHSVRSGRGYRQEYVLRRDQVEERAHALLDGTAEIEPAVISGNPVINSEYGRSQYMDGIREALKTLRSLADERGALRPHRDKLRAEFDRRGGWTRFYLVQDGHIHKDHACFTLKITTRLSWQPELSGKSEEQAVSELGPFLCTFCFPSAPVDWKQDPAQVQAQAKAKENCPGSGEDASRFMSAAAMRRISKYAKCPECGDQVSVTSGWKFRAHKPKSGK